MAEPVILKVWRLCVSQRTVDPDLPCWEKGWKSQEEFQEHHLEHSYYPYTPIWNCESVDMWTIVCSGRRPEDSPVGP